MMCYWFYLWTKIITTCFFRNCVQLLLYVFAKMPDIELVIDIIFFLLHMLSNLSVCSLLTFRFWYFYFSIYLKSWEMQIFSFCLNFQHGYIDIFPYQWPYYLPDLRWSMSYIWRNVQGCHSVHLHLETKLISF